MAEEYTGFAEEQPSYTGFADETPSLPVIDAENLSARGTIEKEEPAFTGFAEEQDPVDIVDNLLRTRGLKPLNPVLSKEDAFLRGGY